MQAFGTYFYWLLRVWIVYHTSNPAFSTTSQFVTSLERCCTLSTLSAVKLSRAPLPSTEQVFEEENKVESIVQKLPATKDNWSSSSDNWMTISVLKSSNLPRQSGLQGMQWKGDYQSIWQNNPIIPSTTMDKISLYLRNYSRRSRKRFNMDTKEFSTANYEHLRISVWWTGSSNAIRKFVKSRPTYVFAWRAPHHQFSHFCNQDIHGNDNRWHLHTNISLTTQAVLNISQRKIFSHHVMPWMTMDHSLTWEKWRRLHQSTTSFTLPAAPTTPVEWSRAVAKGLHREIKTVPLSKQSFDVTDNSRTMEMCDDSALLVKTPLNFCLFLSALRLLFGSSFTHHTRQLVY